MGNRKMILILLFFIIDESLAACNEGLGMDANNRKIPDSSLTASSEQPYYYARYGRLNERYDAENRNLGGWCAYRSRVGELHYLQIDLGSAKTVTEVGTQAVFKIDKWVKTYMLSYSYDGQKWFDHKINGKGQILQGNSDRYDFAKRKIEPPITARYIRILPLTYSGDWPCMRAELYGCDPHEDCKTPVGIGVNVKKIPDSSMSSSSNYFKHFAYEGRLNNAHRVSSTGERSWGAWCPMKTDTSSYLQIDLGRVREISGVATQGYNYNLWTTQYHLNYSMDGRIWKQYTEKGTVKLFVGNSDNETIRTHILVTKVTARFVRFMPVRWNNYPNHMPCLRVEVYDCEPVRGSAPTIVQGISNKMVKRGVSFNLTCIITGQPLMEVSWQKNGNSLSTTDMTSISGFDRGQYYHTSLNFKSIKMGENGNRYSCTANYPGVVHVQAVSTAVIKVDGTIPVLKILKVGEDFVKIALSLKGPIASDILAYEVTLVDFTSSKELLKRYKYNTSMEHQTITGLNAFTKYNINVRLIYLKNSKGSAIPNQQFRTMQCKPKKPPSGLAIKFIYSGSLEVYWQKPENDDCKGPIVGYDIRIVRSELSSKNDYVTMNSTTATSFVVSPLRPGNKYNVTVRARTSVGAGPFTMSSIMFTPAQGSTTTQKSTEKPTPQPTTESVKVKITQELQKIKKTGITKENVQNVTVKVEILTNNSNLLDVKDITVTADILEEVVKINGTNGKIGQALVKTVSNVLNANSSVLEESDKQKKVGIRYVKILENWLEKASVEDKNINETTKNIVVMKINLTKKKIEKDIIFNRGDGTSVTVPVEVLGPDRSNNATKKRNESIYFVHYKKNSFFGDRKEKITTSCVDGYTNEEKILYTSVLASSIVGRDVKNLSKPITLRFKETVSRKSIERAACVYWDFNVNGGMGGWSTEGCKLHQIINHTIVCHCDHMTNFAAMMDVYAHTSKACGAHGKALSYISIIGCFLSLVGLFSTILTYAIFRRLRREIAARIMLQLCTALFVVVVLFLTGLERTKQPTVCMAVGIALHYFTLVAFMWMLMEAIFMYRAFVIIWPPRENNDLLKCSAAAWGSPAIIVIATAASDLANYKGKHYCRVTGIPFFAGFLAPICLILLINLTIFAIIMYKLSTRPTRSVESQEGSQMMRRLKRAFGIMILMGLTWIFGAFAVSDVRLVFQYFFAVCNSLQGLAIFIFYCLSQKNVRDAWYAFFTCDTRSELKIRTDSYYERRRLSSASQKTSTLLPRTRTNSSTVMMRNDSTNCRLQEIQGMLNDQVKMQTIMEMDIEDRYLGNLTSNIGAGDLSYDSTPNLNKIDRENDFAVSSADDSVTRDDSPASLTPYRSYRALSDIKELNDLLNLADIRKSSSKSNEMLVRKSLFVAGSSPLLQPKENMRPVRSCENVNKSSLGHPDMNDLAKPCKFDSQVNDQSQPKSQGRSEGQPQISINNCASAKFDNQNIDPGCAKVSRSNEAIRCAQKPVEDCSTLGSQCKPASLYNTLESDSMTIVPDENQVTESITTDHTDNLGHSACNEEFPQQREMIIPELFPSSQDNASHLPSGMGSSHDDIVRWLHDTTDQDDVPSISSDEYRSSMCSSVNDLSSGLTSCRTSVSSSVSSRQSKKRRDTANSLLGRMIVGPLRGSVRGLEGHVDESVVSYDEMVGNGIVNHVYNCSNASDNDQVTVKSSVLYGSMNSVESEKEHYSEEGYSASEEECNVNDTQMLTGNRTKSTTRNGYMGNQNGYIRSAYV